MRIYARNAMCTQSSTDTWINDRSKDLKIVTTDESGGENEEHFDCMIRKEETINRTCMFI
jgi:hypothetical protein